MPNIHRKLHIGSKQEIKSKYASSPLRESIYKLFRGIEAKNFENVFGSSVLEKGLKEFYRFAVNFFERILPVKIYIKPFNLFEQASEELYPIFKKIVSLKNRGFINEFGWDEQIFNDEPKFLRFVVSPKKDRFFLNGSLGVGKSLDDKKKALIKALGEAVERMSLYLFDCTSRNSFSELGENKAINPDFFSGITQETRKKNQLSSIFKKNHPELSLIFDKNTKFRWVKAHSFLNKNDKYVPLQLISVSHYVLKGEPVIRFPITTGAAAGKSHDDALIRGILEVIERDAFMITWLNQLSPEIIDLNSAPEKIKKITDYFHRYQLELYIIVLPTDFNVPALLGVVIDRSGIGPAVTISAKSSFDLIQAMEDISVDLLSLRSWLRKTKEGAGIPDLSHLSLINRSFYWYRTDKIKEIEFILNGERKTVNYFFDKFSVALAKREIKQQLSFLTHRLKELKLDAYWVDITARELAYLKIPVLKVIIPKAQPIYVDECFPYVEGERLKSVPRKFGFKPAETPFRFPPHPFA